MRRVKGYSVSVAALLLSLAVSEVAQAGTYAGSQDRRLRTEVLLSAPRSAIGQPIPVRVQFRNVSEEPVPYDDVYAPAYARYNDPFEIIGPDGKHPLYTGYWNLNQTVAGERTYPELAPGATLVLFEADLAQDYHMTRPGRYQVRYRGDYAPSSEGVWLELEAGIPSPEDHLVSLVAVPRLFRLVTAKGRPMIVKIRLPDPNIPSDFEEQFVAGVVFQDMLFPNRAIAIYVIRKQLDNWPKRQYLGHGELGHVYLGTFWKAPRTPIWDVEEAQLPEPPEAVSFRARAAKAVSRTLRLQSAVP